MAEVPVRGARFHVQRLGQGPRTVVFVHGLVMDNLSSWYFSVANAVATAAEVILYDLRGHGLSERTPAGYALADMVADLDGVLDALAIERPVTLVGNSLGGLIALAYAMAHGERVEGLVLVDAHVPDERWAADMQRTLGLQGAERDLVIAQNFKNWLGRNSQRKRSRLAENAQGLVYGTSLVADLGRYPAFTDVELAHVRCPVLAVYGERSDIRAHGERLAAVLPACELELLEGSTHSVIWEKTAELRARVLAWVAGPARPAQSAG